MTIPARQPDHVVFLHIPKTAGTTFRQILRQNYPDEARYEFGPDAVAAIERWRGLDQAERDRYQLLLGHMPFGLADTFGGRTVTITFLREPVARVRSTWNFILRTPEHPLHADASSGTVTIDEALQRGLDLTLDNGQARLLSGVWGTVPAGALTEEHFQAALDNLLRDDVLVGLTERFDESVDHFARHLGWTDTSHGRENVSPPQPDEDEAVTAAVTDAIAAANHLDRRLHEAARERLDAGRSGPM